MRPHRECQLLNQTVPVQPEVVCQHLAPIILPVNDNFLIDIRKRNCFWMCRMRGLISEPLAYKAVTLKVKKFISVKSHLSNLKIRFLVYLSHRNNIRSNTEFKNNTGNFHPWNITALTLIQ